MGKYIRDDFGNLVPTDEQPDYLARISAEEKYINELFANVTDTMGIGICNLPLEAKLEEQLGSRKAAVERIEQLSEAISKPALKSGIKKEYTYKTGYEHIDVVVYNNGAVSVKDSGHGCIYWYTKESSSLAFEFARNEKSRTTGLERMMENKSPFGRNNPFMRRYR